MGAPMRLTVGMAILFRHAVLKLGRSPYDARMMIREGRRCRTGRSPA